MKAAQRFHQRFAAALAERLGEGEVAAARRVLEAVVEAERLVANLPLTAKPR